MPERDVRTSQHKGQNDILTGVSVVYTILTYHSTMNLPDFCHVKTKTKTKTLSCLFLHNNVEKQFYAFWPHSSFTLLIMFLVFIEDLKELLSM